MGNTGKDAAERGDKIHEEITNQVNKVDYVIRNGLALTRLDPYHWLIDHNSIIISDIPVPTEQYGKVIKTSRFQYHEPISKVNNKNIINKTEEDFKSFCITNNIKYGSKTYYKYQHIYFNGAIAVLGEVPARWGVNLMSSRPIIENYTKK